MDKKINQMLKNSKDSLANPFYESQSKVFSDEQLIEEFYPTSVFWDIFNSQHEVILGTRGSGKTILMKMACYPLLKNLDNNRAKNILRERSYIGFFIPLGMEWTISISEKEVPENFTEYFTFCFNCLALRSFLKVIEAIIQDESSNLSEQKKYELQIVDKICKILFPNEKNELFLLSDVFTHITGFYSNTIRWSNGDRNDLFSFTSSILSPISLIIDDIISILGNNYKDTYWLACVDEADFVKSTYLKCINSFIRSSKKQVILKMTIMPTKYSTYETLENGVYVSPQGNDFNFLYIDYNPNSKEYEKLTDHVLHNRLKKIIEIDDDLTLNDLIGKVGNESLLEYYQFILTNSGNKYNRKDFENEFASALSSERRKSFYRLMKEDPDQANSQIIEKLSPVFYPRKAKQIDSKGNTISGWSSGPTTIRLITDGNPRKFIQFMNIIIDKAQKIDVNYKTQQRLILKFCKSEFEQSQILPEYGFLLKDIIEEVGNFLSTKVHGDFIVDSGLSFKVKLDLNNNDDKNILETIKIGIDFNHFHINNYQPNIIDDATIISLSYKYGVLHYLPLRTTKTLAKTITFSAQEENRKLRLIAIHRQSYDNQKEFDFS